MSDDFAKDRETFSTLEIDTIGEIMNITMGSAATAASSLLDHKVVITAPNVKVLPLEEFDLGDMEPIVAVDIKYVEGIFGSNILILRREDMRTILSQMLQTDLPAEFEIDEMTESALGELMNQMMGASATVLSSFLGQTINISTPYTIPREKLDRFKEEYFEGDSSILSVEFLLSIEGLVESKFISTMRVGLAKEIIGVSLDFDSQAAAIEEQAPPQPPVQPMPIQPSPGEGMPMQPQQPPQGAYPQQAPMQQPQPPMYPQQPAYPYPPQQPYYGAPAMPQGFGDGPSVVKDYDFSDFGQGGGASTEQPGNLDLVMNVPVVVTVELGRTKKKIKEILEFGQGTIVELDKQAGSQVDVIVNGQLIARGDVVVLDDNFSIRITEILKNRDSLNGLV